MRRDNLIKLSAIYAGVLMASFGAGIARPAIAYFVKYSLHSTMLAAAGLTSGFMAGRALASLLSGVLSELIPRLRPVIIGGGLGIAALILCKVIPESAAASIVVVSMGFWGLLAGFTWPSIQIVTSELGGARSGTALAIYFSLGSLGISLGNYFFGVSQLSYSSLISFSGLFMATSAVILSLASIGTRVKVASNTRAAVNRVLTRLVLWVILAAFTLGFLNGTLREYFYIYVHEVYGYTRGSLGRLLFASGVVSVGSGIIAGLLADRIGIARTLYFVLIASAISALTIGVQFPNALLVAAAYIVASAGVRSSMPLTRNAALVGEIGGSLMVGASNMVSSLGMMTGPLAAGLLYEYSPRYGGIPFLLAGTLLLLTVIIYRRISQ